MKLPAIITLISGMFMLVSSLAHAFLGWPALESLLLAAGVDAETTAALGVGWHFGSMAMAVFGLIVFAISWQHLRGKTPSMLPVSFIAAGYVVFGLTAYIARDLNPHFLMFAVTGLLTGVLPIAKSRNQPL